MRIRTEFLILYYVMLFITIYVYIYALENILSVINDGDIMYNIKYI